MDSSDPTTDSGQLTFRKVSLPDGVPGTLFLHSMPGRREPFETARRAMIDSSVSRVVALVEEDEFRTFSPEYATAIDRGTDWKHVHVPVPDFGIPEDGRELARAADDAAAALARGENVLVHCAAGIGRTGTFAAAVLYRLGLPLHEARRRVRAAGSTAESQSQQEFLETICGKRSR